MKDKNNYLWYIGIGSSILIISTLIINYFYAENRESERGTFGDLFGASNALFTGLSFAGLIITILLQRQELKETRDEFVKQNETLNIQRFENTFFNLLSNHHQIVSDLKSKQYTTKDGEKIYTYFEGRSVFVHLVGILLNNVDDDIDTFNDQYGRFYKDLGFEYGYYMKNVYQIVKMINDKKFDDKELKDSITKEKYINLIWNQLSDHEIALIFYHCSHASFMTEFRKIIEKYGLLATVNDDLIYNDLKTLYDNKAFGHK